MEKELEVKSIVHFNDGYSARLEIGDNPDAPEIYSQISYFEEDHPVLYITLPDEVIPDFIKALNIYLESKDKRS